MREQPPIQITETADPLATPRRIAFVRPNIRPAIRRRKERWVMTFPHLIVRELILLQVVLIALALTAIAFDAPLEGIANPLETPNPAKAPWYFLGLQELLHYFPPIVAGVLMPGLVVIALVVIPYARVNLTAGPLWASDRRRTAIAVGAVTALLIGLFAYFACWPIVIPTLLISASVFVARDGEHGGPLRRRLWQVTLPEWIMTWFVVVATILTMIGTFFRGPGWSLVWPWHTGVSG